MREKILKALEVEAGRRNCRILFAAVLDGLPLAADETKAIGELLERKSRADEKCRVLADVRLDRLLTDRYDELGQIRWRKKLPPTDETRKMLEGIFRRCVKAN